MNGIAVSLIYRREAIAYEVFPAVPRDGEFVRLGDGRKFRVTEIEWVAAPPSASAEIRAVSAKAYIEHVCDGCSIPLSRERVESELCLKCEEVK